VVPPLTTWPVVFNLYSNLQQFVLKATATNNLEAKRKLVCHLLASLSCDEENIMHGGRDRKMRMGGIGKDIDTTTMKRALYPMSIDPPVTNYKI
jgi:hypothetical protein